MRDFYERFYALAPQSEAHALFCQRAFGRNLCQHGFADVVQLQTLVDALDVGPGQRVLDLGCGIGAISETISDQTGAHVTGLDYIPQAIDLARQRTVAKADRLAFVVGDMNDLDLPAASYDAIVSIDTLYFCDDLVRTVGALVALLRPGGRMGIFYLYGWEPGMSREEFDVETLAPDRNPLGQALAALGLAYRTWDFSQADQRLTRERRDILQALEPRFRAEGIGFVYENRMAEVEGISAAYGEGLLRRHLYRVEVPAGDL